MKKNKKNDCCPKSGSNSGNPFSNEKPGDNEKVTINPVKPNSTGSEPGENEPDKNDPTREEIPLPIFNIQ